jgi:ribosomal protein L9
MTITIPAKANEQGHLYRQISPEIVAEAVNKVSAGVPVTAQSIHIKEPIKTTGEYTIAVRLGSHTVSLIVRIIAL